MLKQTALMSTIAASLLLSSQMVSASVPGSEPVAAAGNSSLMVVIPIEFNKQADMAFGALIIPDDSESYEFDLNDSGNVESGGRVVANFGNPHLANYDIQGAANYSVRFNSKVENGYCVGGADGDVLLTNVTPNFDVLTLNANGVANIDVAGSIKVKGGAAAADYTCDYQLSAQYE